MQFRVVSTESGNTGAYFDSVSEGRTGFEATWSIEGDKIKFDVAAIKLKFRGTLNEAGDTAEGTWSQGGREVPLTLKKQPTEYSSVNVWKNRPQRPVAPFPYDSEDVKFENQRDNVTLAGTLTIPKKPGKHPVAVLISGSGPSDRDESIMEHKPFLVLADYLTRRGIAVLRYDDRGTNESTGKFSIATTEDFAQDASAAVGFLKHHERINPDQIGLAGHSEGGLIAPMVVGLRDDIAFVCLLAATGVDGATINQSQTEALLRAEGVDESEIQIVLKINRAVINVSTKAEPDADLSNEFEDVIKDVVQSVPESDRELAEQNIRKGIQNSKGKLQSQWMRFFLTYDPRPALTRIKCPVLAMIGTKDLQVLPDLNMPEIKKALTAGGNQDFEIVELEGLNHLFQQCETGAMSEYVTIQETFNPKALKKIGDWIISHTTLVD
jgi:pimeloyl-ACP methyl ester carboxylesterase